MNRGALMNAHWVCSTSPRIETLARNESICLPQAFLSTAAWMIGGPPSWGSASKIVPAQVASTGRSGLSLSILKISPRTLVPAFPPTFRIVVDSPPGRIMAWSLGSNRSPGVRTSLMFTWTPAFSAADSMAFTWACRDPCSMTSPISITSEPDGWGK